MSAKNVTVLVGYLLRFFLRRVMTTGMLSTLGARLGIGVLALTIVGILATLSYMFLSEMQIDTALLGLLLDMSSVSAVFWVLVLFVFVKVLFAKADSLYALTFQLPVTNRERSAAFLIYETTMVLAGVVLLFLSTVAPIVLLFGAEAIPRVLTSIIFPAVTVYLGLSIIYSLLERVLVIFRLGRWKNIVLVAACMGMIYAYNATILPATQEISFAYLDGGEANVWSTFYSRISEEAGTLLATAIFAGVLVALAGLALFVTPTVYVPPRKFIRLIELPIRPLGRLTPYVLQVLRSFETWMAALLALLTYVVLQESRPVPPLLALGALSFLGLYAYSATAPLRAIDFRATSPVRQYFHLITAQIIVVSALLFGFSIVELAQGTEPLELLGVSAGVYASLLTTTLIGIMFPPERDNPFSVFMGILVALTIGLLIVVGLGLLNLPALALWAAALVTGVLIITYSIFGIRTNERRNRHEIETQDYHHPSGSADNHSCGHHPLVPGHNVQHHW